MVIKPVIILEKTIIQYPYMDTWLKFAVAVTFFHLTCNHFR